MGYQRIQVKTLKRWVLDTLAANRRRCMTPVHIVNVLHQTRKLRLRESLFWNGNGIGIQCHQIDFDVLDLLSGMEKEGEVIGIYGERAQFKNVPFLRTFKLLDPLERLARI